MRQFQHAGRRIETHRIQAGLQRFLEQYAGPATEIEYSAVPLQTTCPFDHEVVIIGVVVWWRMQVVAIPKLPEEFVGPIFAHRSS
ncbi:hypothetical protein D3C77_535900 [compost metagenome]